MLDTKSIFGVDGMVAVVTGGGTGPVAPVLLMLSRRCIQSWAIY